MFKLSDYFTGEMSDYKDAGLDIHFKDAISWSLYNVKRELQEITIKLSKNSLNQDVRSVYDYYDKIGRLLTKYFIGHVPNIKEESFFDVRENVINVVVEKQNKEKIQTRYTSKVYGTVKFYSYLDDSFIEVTCEGASSDTSCKSNSQAQTFFIKQAFEKTFIPPTRSVNMDDADINPNENAKEINFSSFDDQNFNINNYQKPTYSNYENDQNDQVIEPPSEKQYLKLFIDCSKIGFKTQYGKTYNDKDYLDSMRIFLGQKFPNEKIDLNSKKDLIKIIGLVQKSIK